MCKRFAYLEVSGGAPKRCGAVVTTVLDGGQAVNSFTDLHLVHRVPVLRPGDLFHFTLKRDPGKAPKNLRLHGLLVCAVLLTATVLMPARPAAAASAAASATFEIRAQVEDELPYQPPPDIGEVDPSAWAEALEPLVRLPLWAQAAFASAAIAGLYLVLPILKRWLWTLGGDDRSRQST